MANKKRMDPETEAALEMINVERLQDEIKVKEQLAKENAIAQIFEAAGVVKTLTFNEAQARFFKLIFLKRVKDSKEHRERFGMSWEQFCEHVKVNRRWIDEQLTDLKPFKVEFLEGFLHFSGFDFHKIKYLGQAIAEETARIEGNSIIYKGDSYPISDAAIVLAEIESEIKALKEEQDAILRAKDKVLKSKDDVINKQERTLRKFEKDAKTKGLTLEEDAFMQRMENDRIIFDGLMLTLDPERIEELGDGADPTPRMIASYLTTLDYIRKQILSAYNTAVEIHGDPVTTPEAAWKPGMKAK